MPTARVLPYGERAVLLEVGSIPEVLGVYDDVRALRLDGVEDVVPASRTVLVSFVDAAALQRAMPALRSIDVHESEHDASDAITIDVVYDGEDLPDVAKALNMTVDDVIAKHTAVSYTVAFYGFSPGFAYLTGLDPELTMPRRPSPRTKVPAGSLGMTGPFTAVYPRASPGGWQLLGRTEVAMWDADRDQPSLLNPGMHVTFRAVG